MLAMFSALYRGALRPLLFRLSPESAHSVAMLGLDLGTWGPGAALMRALCQPPVRPALQQTLWGLNFANPVGLAAGFDKNAAHLDGLACLGFSHIEAGTVTGEGQAGNPQPRSFRLPEDGGLINRMGFNNQGSQAVAARLAARAQRPRCVLGVNIGKTTAVPLEQALDDHLCSLERLAPHADYVVVNVSCPNVQGVTGLQTASSLRPLLEGLRARLRALRPQVPMLVKLGPDISGEALEAAVETILGTQCEGILATNTTRSREGLRTPAQRIAAIGNGGLSGAPLRAAATAQLARIARLTQGKVPLIGIGGIDSAEAAWEKITHGASLVQVYTGFIYQGPLLIRAICAGLERRVQRLGLKHLREAVGRDL